MEEHYFLYSETIDDFIEVTKTQFKYEEVNGHSIINQKITLTIDERGNLGWNIEFGNASGHVMLCLHNLERRFALAK